MFITQAKMIFILFTIFAVANAGHWVEWMVFQKQCGTVERRCVADSYSEANPVCPGTGSTCDSESTYGSWEDANSKLKNVVNLQIGSELKKVPIMISEDGSRYLIFQRRVVGNVDFYKKWTEYVNGFGNPDGDFWLGLKALNHLTTTGNYNMLVVLIDFNGTVSYASYSKFEVKGATDKYRLKIGNYSGTAGDAMKYHDSRTFSTYDQDTDGNDYDNSAIAYHGGWWYGQCHEANLNGKYFPAPGTHNSYGNGVNWNPFGGYYRSMKLSIMAVSLN